MDGKPCCGKRCCTPATEPSENLPCYPITFEIRSDEIGKPYLLGDATKDIHVSLAHKGKDAVAIARQDRSVGIDMELIEERSTGFYPLVFTDAEMELLKDRDQAEWTTRFWVAKEAYGKFLGTGLQGNPKDMK
ncbi:4'-phosphopantetheinyl transferase superfamily protein [Sphingobacterium sp. E70]|uniref:4'-phosphopantetheinyl transferase family protein n=1 Tax=Sphingobacterium sp. E70 TaxID=2853439 RepID=UPI00211C607A|nr:4'-phosphopantetheinyl transferase superfamily protein [Sphingobacterium sp. E70]ULT22644.1 4'-phosphopantetheinyl transferase superfamily protein [Sphingobacterium sp. E70]